jgi:predicted GNAT family acetyltransferase
LLVEHAFRHARDQGYVVRASCPFVRAWARERPEYQELLER